MASRTLAGVWAAMATPTLRTPSSVYGNSLAYTAYSSQSPSGSSSSSSSSSCSTLCFGSRPSIVPDSAGALPMLRHLHASGCHGAVVFGTTGEASSFSTAMRLGFAREVLQARARELPDFGVVVGTGCTNLDDTVALTRGAFDDGADGVLVVPPFYFKNVADSAMVAWYAQVIENAVPPHGKLLLYHFPQMSGVPVPKAVVAELVRRYPGQIAGIKDSTDQLDTTLDLCASFNFAVFAGSDSILAASLAGRAAGCITALANVLAPLLRAVWDAHQSGGADDEAQQRLARARVLVKGLPGPAVVKAALHQIYGLPLWSVAPPLEELAEPVRSKLVAELRELLGGYADVAPQ